MADEWLTVDECADLFRLHPKTLYRQLGAGTFPVPAVRIGRQWRISAAGAAELLGAVAYVLATAVEP